MNAYRRCHSARVARVKVTDAFIQLAQFYRWNSDGRPHATNPKHLMVVDGEWTIRSAQQPREFRMESNAIELLRGSNVEATENGGFSCAAGEFFIMEHDGLAFAVMQ